MYRVIAIIVGGLLLAACSSTPSWMSLDALKPQPIMDNVRFESEPPGAEAKVSNGQTCVTPCSLSLAANGAYSVVFSLKGYQLESDNIELVSVGDGTSKLRPDPVLVELTPAPPPAKPTKKPSHRKPVSKKPIAKKSTGKPAAKPAQAAPAAVPAAPAQAQAPSSSPWPSAPPAQQTQQ